MKIPKPKWLCASFVNKSGKHIGTTYLQSGRNELLRDDIRVWVIKNLPDSPIGEIALLECPASEVPKDHKYHDRLLSRSEMEEVTETMSVGEARDARG